MFDSSLSCSALALPHREYDSYVASARLWSGDADLNTGQRDFVSWTESSKIEITDSTWFRDVSPILVNTTRAVGRVATVGRLDIVVVLSAFSSVTAALKEHLGRNTNRLSSGSIELEVDLGRFCRKEWRKFAPAIRSVDMTTNQGLRLVATATPSLEILPAPPDGYAVDAIMLAVNGREVRLTKNLDLKVENIESNFAEVIRCLVDTFGVFGGYISEAPVTATAPAGAVGAA